LPSTIKEPESLDDFPHNPFGDRLRVLGEELGKEGKRKDIATRLALVAHEDSDGDGVDNETELLAGANPGRAASPSAALPVRPRSRQGPQDIASQAAAPRPHQR
jgi:hypothetical protein